MRINTNLTAMNTYTQYTKNNNKIASSVEKLSSGYAINSAADNAAGLAISEKMRAQIRGLEQASSNSQDAISLVQTAEGAMGSATEILQRMREIAVQSSSDTNNDDIDRTALQDEFSQLQSELDDISDTTSFNKKNLLDGSLSATKKSVTNATLGNSSLAVSIGNATAGDYNFNVSVKQETAAVAGKQATDYSAVLGTDAKNYFAAATGITGSLGDGETSKVTLGANASASAILNGNYTMTTASNADGSLTVTATGDNGQTFEATITSSTLTALETSSAADVAALDLEFSADAGDAFTLTLGVSKYSNDVNGIASLSSAIEDATVSIAGGVTAQDATYGVYASITGGDSVKLSTGDTSVTFSNGTTVSFNELSATDLDTSNAAKIAGDLTGTGLTAANGVNGMTTTYSNFKATDNSIIANSTADDFAIVATDADTLTASVGGESYTVDLTAAQLDSLDFAAGDALGDTNTLSLTFNDASGNAAFTIDVTTTRLDTADTLGPTSATDVTTTMLAAAASANGRVSGSGHNYSKVFGDGTSATLTNNGASSFTVSEAANAGLTFQVGANENDELSVNLNRVDAEYLGVNSAKVTTQEAASAAVTAVDDAINNVSSQRAYLGAIQNRLDYKISNLDTSSENLTAAESQIRDVDMAKEMTNFTNANILQQAATAMLAQANSLPQNVLSLIG